MNNTVGIIDSDYFSDNEGHIFMKITNDSNEGKTVECSVEPDLHRNLYAVWHHGR